MIFQVCSCYIGKFDLLIVSRLLVGLELEMSTFDNYIIDISVLDNKTIFEGLNLAFTLF
jgi:hypothetical protein